MFFRTKLKKKQVTHIHLSETGRSTQSDNSENSSTGLAKYGTNWNPTLVETKHTIFADRRSGGNDAQDGGDCQKQKRKMLSPRHRHRHRRRASRSATPSRALMKKHDDRVWWVTGDEPGLPYDR